MLVFVLVKVPFPPAVRVLFSYKRRVYFVFEKGR